MRMVDWSGLGAFTACTEFESTSCPRAAFGCVLVVNLVLVKLFKSDPTKLISSAAT